AGAKMLAKDGERRLVVTGAGAKPPLPSDIEIVGLPKTDGQIAPAAILAALAERGLRRVLIEGGADTVSRFLAARCLDRLHILIAPIILGAGRSSLTLPPLQHVRDALSVPMHAHRLWHNTTRPTNLAVDAFNRSLDILLDCDLRSHRLPIGRANMST